MIRNSELEREGVFHKATDTSFASLRSVRRSPLTTRSNTCQHLQDLVYVFIIHARARSCG